MSLRKQLGVFIGLYLVTTPVLATEPFLVSPFRSDKVTMAQGPQYHNGAGKHFGGAFPLDYGTGLSSFKWKTFSVHAAAGGVAMRSCEVASHISPPYTDAQCNPNGFGHFVVIKHDVLDEADEKGDIDGWVSTQVMEATSGEIVVGGQVRASTDTVNVRQNAGFTDKVGTQYEGAVGIVIAGPEEVDEHTWWKVDFEAPSYFSLYAHLEGDTIEADIPQKQRYDTAYESWHRVEADELLGMAGDSGFGSCLAARCIHLHFELFTRNYREAYTSFSGYDPYNISTASKRQTRLSYPEATSQVDCGEDSLWLDCPSPRPDPNDWSEETLIQVVDSGVNVREPPGKESLGALVGAQSGGATGRIVSDNVLGPPVYLYPRWWWKVDFDQGPDGWVAEEFLESADVGVEDLVLYDDFNHGFIDYDDRWREGQSGGSAKEVEDGELHLAANVEGRTTSDSGFVFDGAFLDFKDPSAVSAVEMTVTVNEADATNCEENPEAGGARFAFQGALFNVGTAVPGSWEDDLRIELNIFRSSFDVGDELSVQGTMHICTNSNCSATREDRRFTLGTVDIGEPTTIGFEWRKNDDEVVFTMDGDETVVEYSDQPTGPAGVTVMGMFAAGFPPNCTTAPAPHAIIDVSIDNVYTNEGALP